MNEDTTMNEAAMRQEIERLRESVNALSGRIDGMDRGEILRAVKDDRRDKLSERHAQAFGRHAGDAVPHTYRDYLNPHRIPGMVEVRPYEDAAAADPYRAAIAKMSWSGSTDLTTPVEIIPFDTLMAADTDASVVRSDPANNRIVIVEAGYYIVAMVVHVRAQRGVTSIPSESGYASSASATLRGEDAEGNARHGCYVQASLRDQLVFNSGLAFDGDPPEHNFLAGPITLVLPMQLDAGDIIRGRFTGILEHSGAGAGNTYLSAIRVSE